MIEELISFAETMSVHLSITIITKEAVLLRWPLCAKINTITDFMNAIAGTTNRQNLNYKQQYSHKQPWLGRFRLV